MNTNEDILLRIANTLMVYAYHMKENGLMRGKTGAMLFLYLFSQHSGSEVCYDFAGELLDGLMKSGAEAPSSFEEGIAGLGWATGRLMRADIVGGDPNKVLGSIDSRLLGALGRNQWSETWNELIYFADRLADRPPLTGGKDMASILLSFIRWQTVEEHHRLTDAQTRAVSHFLRRVEALRGKSPQTAELRKHLDTHLGIKHTPLQQETNLPVEQQISTAIWQKIFHPAKAVCLPKSNVLLDHVGTLQTRLSPAALSLSGGLAGIGTIILYKLLSNN